jgi:hypothetical protein
MVAMALPLAHKTLLPRQVVATQVLQRVVQPPAMRWGPGAAEARPTPEV